MPDDLVLCTRSAPRGESHARDFQTNVSLTSPMFCAWREYCSGTTLTYTSQVFKNHFIF